MLLSFLSFSNPFTGVSDVPFSLVLYPELSSELDASSAFVAPFSVAVGLEPFPEMIQN